MGQISIADTESVWGLFSAAMAGHPEQERVSRFARAGAAYTFRPLGDVIELSLEFDENAVRYAASRAADARARGDKSYALERPQGNDLYDRVVLALVPSATFRERI